MWERFLFFRRGQVFCGVFCQKLFVDGEVFEKGFQRRGFPLAGGAHIVALVCHKIHKLEQVVGFDVPDKFQAYVFYGNLLQWHAGLYQGPIDL